MEIGTVLGQVGLDGVRACDGDITGRRTLVGAWGGRGTWRKWYCHFGAEVGEDGPLEAKGGAGRGVGSAIVQVVKWFGYCREGSVNGVEYD